MSDTQRIKVTFVNQGEHPIRAIYCDTMREAREFIKRHNLVWSHIERSTTDELAAEYVKPFCLCQYASIGKHDEDCHTRASADKWRAVFAGR